MATASDAVDFDLETVNNVEEAAYQDGYQQGFDHGALHGTFEGRELGREKGFELWEEVAFYKGLAKVWKECLEQAEAAGHASRKQSKQLQHLAGLEKLISFFPTTNTSEPSTDLRPTEPTDEVGEESEDAEAETTNDDELAKLDMLALLEKIRAKYRLTCSVLGIAPQRAPSLAQIGRSRQDDESDSVARAESKSVLVAGKLVDPTQLKY